MLEHKYGTDVKDAFKYSAGAVYNVYSIKNAPTDALKKGVIDNTFKGGGARWEKTENIFHNGAKKPQVLAGNARGLDHIDRPDRRSS